MFTYLHKYGGAVDEHVLGNCVICDQRHQLASQLEAHHPAVGCCVAFQEPKRVLEKLERGVSLGACTWEYSQIGNHLICGV